jgi:hypothetical protein
LKSYKSSRVVCGTGESSVSLWDSFSEHDFGDDTIDDFREWIGRALGHITAPYGACVDCDYDTFSGREYYIVQDAIWKAAAAASPRLPGGLGLLCIGCLERRLGRELTRADFELDNPLNQASRDLSDHLRDRLARVGPTGKPDGVGHGGGELKG